MTNQLNRRAALALGASAAAMAALPAQAAEKKMAGILPVVSTPYTPAGDIDWDDLANEMKFFDRCGAQGAVWPQATSDLALMNKEERFKGMQVIADACRNLNVMSCLGVQAPTTGEMLELAHQAEAVNCDALICMPPSAEQSMEAYYAYYKALAGVTKKPVMVQTSIPGAKNPIVPSTELLFRLAREFPNLAYIKEECEPLVDRMHEELANPAIKGVYGASAGEPWLLQLRAGETGESTAQGMYTDVMVAIWKQYHSGRQSRAAEGYAKILLMKNCQAQIPGTERYIFKKRGVFKSTAARAGAKPGQKVIVPELTKEQVDEIEFRFATLKPWLSV